MVSATSQECRRGVAELIPPEPSTHAGSATKITATHQVTATRRALACLSRSFTNISHHPLTGDSLTDTGTALAEGSPSGARGLWQGRYLWTTDNATDRTRRRVLLILAVFSITLVGRFALMIGTDTPWVAPDEMLYVLLGKSFWEHGSYSILGGDAAFYGMYGFIPGGLTAALGMSAGMLATQLLQVLAVGVTGAVTLVWARRVAAPPWALAAAALTLVLPGLDLAGLMMTEATFVAATTLALFGVCTALTRPSWSNSMLVSGAILLALQIRLQGVLLIPLFFLSALVTAIITRDSRTLRSSLPALLGLSVWAVIWWTFVRGHGGTLGAYSTVLKRSPSPWDGLEWVVWHLADVVVMVAVIPVIAVLSLAVLVVRRAERDRDVIALTVTALTWLVLSVVTVGFFSSQYVGHVVGRHLLSVAPPLFVGYAAWSSRRLWRLVFLTTAVAVPTGVFVASVPETVLGPVASTYDAVELVPFRLLAENSSALIFRLTWVVVVLAAVASIVSLARTGLRGAVTVTGVMVCLLAASSIVGAHRIKSAAEFDRGFFFGGQSPSWIDETIGGPTVLLDEGSIFWNDYWQQAVWNDQVTAVASVVPDDSARGLPGRVGTTLYDDGTLRVTDDRVLIAQNVVASEFTTLVGEPRSRLRRGPDLPDFVAWRTDGRVAVSTRLRGTDTDGTSEGAFKVEVFRCVRGSLELSIRALSQPSSVSWTVQGTRDRTTVVRAGDWQKLRIALPGAPGGGVCVIALEPTETVAVGLVRRFPAIRASNPIPSAQPLDVFERMPPRGTQLGYCFDSVFVQLAAGQPRTDPAYRGAVLAAYVEGIGLTCTVPPGYRRMGYAGDRRTFHPEFTPSTAPSNRDASCAGRQRATTRA